jgi:pimeloyl-ACP methyl ester carboxylesterase
MPVWIIFIIVSSLITSSVSGLFVPGISDQPVKEVQVGDISIGYKEFGSGDPLILIMGSNGAMDIWDPYLLKNLSSDHRVIIFDNRGVGHTSDSKAEYTITRFANDTAGLMDALQISQGDILGWSMGGMIALQLAADKPGLVRTLILYATDPGGEQAIPPNPEVLTQLSNISGTDRERGERLLSLMLPSTWLAQNRDPRVYFPDATERVNGTAVSGQIHAISTWEGVYDKLGTLKSPVLLITGDEDRIVPPENSDKMAAKVPLSTMIKIKNGGHGVMYQYPGEFSRSVLKFLENQTLQN